jgi:UDP-glucose 4-epimerase
LGKRLLVTGGAGFIGSHVSEFFLDRGWSVDVLDDLSTGRRERVPAAASFHEANVGSGEAARLVREGSHDAIVHLAAQMDVRKSVADPMFDAASNVLGTLNLLESLRAAGRMSACRFVFASTGGAIYGDFVTPPNKETYAKEPESPYAISKLAAEYYLAYYARLHGLDAVSLRFANVYGPRQDPHGEAGVVAIFCGRILEGRALTIYGEGTQTRDYVYVGDVANATWLAATRPLPPAGRLDDRAFNIGTGVATSVNDLAAVLLRVTEHRVPVEHAPPRVGEQAHSYLDAAKAREGLGWRAETELRNGLEQTFRWFESRHLTKTGHR